MNTLEIIHLRSCSEPIDALVERISASLRQAGSGSPVVKLLRRRELKTDLAIHIRPDPSGVATAHEVALRLAAELRTYGLVEHTRWEELP